MSLIFKILLLIPKFFERVSQESNKMTLVKLGRGQVHQSLKVGKKTFLQVPASVKQLSIGKDVSWKSNNAIRMHADARLILKDNVYFSDFVSINCLDTIIVGENSWIGEGSKLYDHNHAYDTLPEYNWKVNEFDTAPIVIGNNVKIYSNVTILKGVTIGDNCIIGANCIIYKDIPPFSLVINQSKNIIRSLTTGAE